MKFEESLSLKANVVALCLVFLEKQDLYDISGFSPDPENPVRRKRQDLQIICVVLLVPVDGF
ncbi:MAG: hypothetical protein MUC41_17670 [Syntrophobacteraceae bacterium]|jgi:hypothetical protein|nr:hypothetical protein [Syntrophobacteraceae bacterium]